MFKSKKRMENVAAIPSGIPRPPQTIIQNAPSQAAVILAKGLLILILAPVLWWFLLYVVEEMGYRNPVRTVGWTVAIVGGLLAFTQIARNIGTHFFLLWKDYKLQAKEIEAEIANRQALTAGAPPPTSGRLTGEQKRLFENLALVMQQAYQDLADSGGYQGGKSRPWSKRSVLAMDPPRYGKMPDSQATRIREWLVERSVIVGESQNDQINTELYPAFTDFLALLKEEFDLPVVVRTQKALSPILRQEVNFIEN